MGGDDPPSDADRMNRQNPRPITKPVEAQQEILRILSERYLGSLTPGTDAHTELARLMVTAGLWRPARG